MKVCRCILLVSLSALLSTVSVQCQGQGASKEAKVDEKKPAAAKPKEPVVEKPAGKLAQKIKVTLADIEVTLYDGDAGKAASTQKLTFPNKIGAPISVGENQKLIIKFTVKNQATNQAIRSDQAFVRLSHAKADKEIVIVSETDGDGYKVEMDLAKRAADFSRLIGSYDLRIDVGDVNFVNAISALLGSVKLNFPNGIEELPNTVERYLPKPEIKHTFREPEKRPPATVSLAFSVGVIVPFVLLWVLWARLGINFKNLDVHPSSLVFYASLGGVFFLYYSFWVYLDMFTTLKYLTGLGVVVFLSGNAMFARMHRKRTGKSTTD